MNEIDNYSILLWNEAKCTDEFVPFRDVIRMLSEDVDARRLIGQAIVEAPIPAGVIPMELLDECARVSAFRYPNLRDAITIQIVTPPENPAATTIAGD